jgi:hypothetical protein
MADTLTVLIIRHAEKPGEKWPGRGVTFEGERDDKSLVIRGWQRAGAWAALFGAGLGRDDYPKPDIVYAAQPGSGPPGEGPSRRPFETVTLLGDRLKYNPPIIDAFPQGKEPDLVDAVMKRSGVALISWEHKAIISAILPLIPIGGKAPTHWPGDRFDVVVRLDRAAGKEKFACRMLYPCLLSGDTADPFPGTT